MTLTPRQNEVLVYVREQLIQNGVAPTLAEIANQFSISREGARRLINLLIKAGRLERSDSRFRNIVTPASDQELVSVHDVVGVVGSVHSEHKVPQSVSKLVTQRVLALPARRSSCPQKKPLPTKRGASKEQGRRRKRR